MSIHAHASDPSFEEIMAAQLRRAPWLAVSLIAHGVLLLILLLIPLDEPAPKAPLTIAMTQPTEVVPIEEPEPEPEPDPEPEKVEEEMLEPSFEIADAVEPQELTDVTEFTSDSHEPVGNTMIGLSGPPPAKYGPRGSSRGTGTGGGSFGFSCTGPALEWLARHQDEDGRWDADEFMKHDVTGEPCDGAGNPTHDVGVTGLALLAFLGDGHTLRTQTEYQPVVRAAVRWLTEQQDPNTGLIGAPNSNEFIYDHAIAALALVEACGLSRSRILRPRAQSALAYLERHRNPYGVWRYQPRDGEGDTSITGWCVLAYKAGQDFGFEVNETALDYAQTWFDRMTDPVTGRTGYTERGGPSSRHAGDHETRFPREHGECMSAVSLLCRVFMGSTTRSDPLLKSQTALVADKPPVWDEDAGTIDHYAWYYATYAIYQIGGTTWKRWSKSLRDAVVATQRKDGNARGSWDPVGVWGETGGRVYSTAILCLTSQAYHRYARVLVR